jgi:hypothetical protein
MSRAERARRFLVVALVLVRLPVRVLGRLGSRWLGRLRNGDARGELADTIAAGVFEPWGLTLRPEIAAISMSCSSILVAVNALALKRLRLLGS